MVLTIVDLINHLAFKILEFKSPMDTLLTLHPNIHTTIGARTPDNQTTGFDVWQRFKVSYHIELTWNVKYTEG